MNVFEPDDSDLGWHWGGSNVSSTPNEEAALPPPPPVLPDDEGENDGNPDKDETTGSGEGNNKPAIENASGETSGDTGGD